MEIIKLALRNLSRQKKRTFLLGGAIAFGIMIVTIINGFVGAFVSNISENFANLAAGPRLHPGRREVGLRQGIDIIRDDAVLLAGRQAKARHPGQVRDQALLLPGHPRVRGQDRPARR